MPTPDDGPRLTEPTLRLLRALLEHPGHVMYGYELLREATLLSGTMYPALARLRDYGWLTADREQIDPSVEGRPARTYYRLTAPGAQRAQEVLARLSVRPPELLPRWGFA